MSEYSIVALGMLVIGVLILACGVIAIFKQKTYVDPTGKSVQNEIDIPLWGKVKTNTPAIVLAFLGAFVVWQAGKLETTIIEHNEPAMVPITGELVIDGQLPNIPSLTVGLVSGGWVQTATLGGERTIPVRITAPNSWSSYFAFVFSQNDGRVRPKMIGTGPNSNFSLKVEP
jgi:hypothetical protein